MASVLRLKLLGHDRDNGGFFVSTPTLARPIRVSWDVTISNKKLQDIKRLMVKANVQYLCVDCLCINQDDEAEKSSEIAQMYEYYKSANKWLLGLFSGLFTADEIEDIQRDIKKKNGDAIETFSFAFFKRLSIKTADCFAAVVNLGRLKRKGLVKTSAIPGIRGGCNCGKKERGRILVRSATILGSLMDPGGDVVEYRRRLLRKLRPQWRVTDASAKPATWIGRCWRLENETTANGSCDVRVNCGCTIVAPFSLMMEAITAMEGSSLRGTPPPPWTMTTGSFYKTGWGWFRSET
ncbi:hypothetical protein VTK56DRAFT_9376 [Thermocarpiscus australiensis]